MKVDRGANPMMDTVGSEFEIEITDNEEGWIREGGTVRRIEDLAPRVARIFGSKV